MLTTTSRRTLMLAVALAVSACTDAAPAGEAVTTTSSIVGVTLVPGGSPLPISPASLILSERDGSVTTPYLTGDPALQGIAYTVPNRSTLWSLSIDAITLTASDSGDPCLLLVGHATVLRLDDGARSTADDVPLFFAASDSTQVDTSESCDASGLDERGYRHLGLLTLPIGAEVGFYYPLALAAETAELAGLGTFGASESVTIDVAQSLVAAADVRIARTNVGTITSRALSSEASGHFDISYRSPLNNGTTSDGDILAVVELNPSPTPPASAQCFGIVGTITATTVAPEVERTAAVDAPDLSLTSRIGPAETGYAQCDTAPLSAAGYLPATSYEVEEGESSAFFIPVYVPDDVEALAVIMGQRDDVDVLYELVVSDVVPPAP